MRAASKATFGMLLLLRCWNILLRVPQRLPQNANQNMLRYINDCLQFWVAFKLYQLQEEHSIIKNLRINMSGLPWSNQTGLSIGVDEAGTWKIYLMVSSLEADFLLIGC
jgi:hypothetical protein